MRREGGERGGNGRKEEEQERGGTVEVENE